jgi:hypothetical protein
VRVLGQENTTGFVNWPEPAGKMVIGKLELVLQWFLEKMVMTLKKVAWIDIILFVVMNGLLLKMI